MGYISYSCAVSDEVSADIAYASRGPSAIDERLVLATDRNSAPKAKLTDHAVNCITLHRSYL